jgi:hypothetical protein
MDFANLNSIEHGDRGATFYNIKGLDDKPIPGVSVTLLGANSKIGRAASTLALRKIIDDKDGVDTYDMRKARTLDKMVALTIDWSGIDMNGKEYKCTPENVRALYSNPAYDWFYVQIIEFVEKAANFLPKADDS